ncbi:MAG: hypothetical protein Q7U57_01890 [Methylovulum sp.]|nr:hypothetical protein [Methylovulum sp.]
MNNLKRLQYFLAGTCVLVTLSVNAAEPVAVKSNNLVVAAVSAIDIAQAKADAASAVKAKKDSYRTTLNDLKTQFKNKTITQSAYLRKVNVEKRQYSKAVNVIYLTLQKTLRGRPVSPS